MKKVMLFMIMITSTVALKAQGGWVLSGSNVRLSSSSYSVSIGSFGGMDKLSVTGTTGSDQFNASNGIFNVPNTTTDLFLRTNNVTRLWISKNNGYVRIGPSTEQPAYALDVSGTVNATQLRIAGGLVTSSQWVTSSANINYTAGNVSIGTTAVPAGYKLIVKGKTLTEEVVVKLQANWPDYVFSKSYNLMPLSDLELYINKNKHLPEVPSAKEVAENGIAVGEMNATLLKKIEELTLYMIELKRENEKQQELINKLLEKAGSN